MSDPKQRPAHQFVLLPKGKFGILFGAVSLYVAYFAWGAAHSHALGTRGWIFGLGTWLSFGLLFWHEASLIGPVMLVGGAGTSLLAHTVLAHAEQGQRTLLCAGIGVAGVIWPLVILRRIDYRLGFCLLLGVGYGVVASL